MWVYEIFYAIECTCPSTVPPKAAPARSWLTASHPWEQRLSQLPGCLPPHWWHGSHPLRSLLSLRSSMQFSGDLPVSSNFHTLQKHNSERGTEQSIWADTVIDVFSSLFQRIPKDVSKSSVCEMVMPCPTLTGHT